ncbi:MAG: FdtA/QdtA family cupin domain-containing protein [Candidatus Levybacteria bacterium]|nr:FdtA/QdtA family cupin domain-containing protein [Candidatus Levybacteria bacterium]
MNKFQKFTLKTFESDKIHLTPIELKEYIDFEPKRLYYVTNVHESTGAHCHFEEKEFFIIIAGTCVATIDQGNGIEEIPMAKGDSIYAANYVWHGFKKISEDFILLAVSSTNYRPDRSDYLEDYEEYLKVRDKGLAS